MVWQVNIDMAAQEEGKLVLYTTFSDGKSKIGETFKFEGGPDLDDRWKRILQAKLDALENAGLSFVKVPLGIPDLTIVPSIPTAKQIYAGELNTLRQMKRAIDLTIKKDTDQDFGDLLALVKVDFKDEYIDLF